MENSSDNIIEGFYEKNNLERTNSKNLEIRKSEVAKYKIFDESEFTRGREVLGNLIVRGMLASGGTDIDWMIEHNGGFIILEFKGFHNDKINIPLGQMIAYERLHQRLNQNGKCFLYIIGCDDIDFSNPDSSIWIFEMNQWNNKVIPKNTNDIFSGESNSQKKFLVYREYMEEISVEKLREIIDVHWKNF